MGKFFFLLNLNIAIYIITSVGLLYFTLTGAVNVAEGSSDVKVINAGDNARISCIYLPRPQEYKPPPSNNVPAIEELEVEQEVP